MLLLTGESPNLADLTLNFTAVSVLVAFLHCNSHCSPNCAILDSALLSLMNTQYYLLRITYKYIAVHCCGVQRTELHFTILPYPLNCTALLSTLYCTAQNYSFALVYCIALHYSLHRNVMHSTSTHCTTMPCAAMQCSLQYLYCTALHCTVCTAWGRILLL